MDKKDQAKYDKRLKKVYKKADERLKDGSLRLEDYTSYVRGYMKEDKTVG